MFQIPPLTSDIFALSLDGAASPAFEVELFQHADQENARGWGFGWYPHDRELAMTPKDPEARGTQELVRTVTEWESFRSTTFFLKVRGASKGYSHTDVQPFSRNFAGRDFLFMHNGYLDKRELEKICSPMSPYLEPMGSTDSELVFCELLTRAANLSARRLADVPPETLLSWLQAFDALGSFDICLSDAESIAVFCGTKSSKQLAYTRVFPPDNQQLYRSAAASISLSDPRDTYRTALIFSSSPFENGSWTPFAPGQLLIARRGAIVFNSAPDAEPRPANNKSTAQATVVAHATATASSETKLTNGHAAVSPEQSKSSVVIKNVRSVTQTAEGKPLGFRQFRVAHRTTYKYSNPVEHSTHIFRLEPLNDLLQEVVHSTLSISVEGEEIQYEDVFGNRAVHYSIKEDYKELQVEAESIVKVFAAPPDDHNLSRRRTSIPLVWMPWHRQMMMPYLLPMELPESELIELTEYAMSFVERNDYHLLQTIEDINRSIHRDYKYFAGTTSLSTTPFEVYTSRQGVCQDFTNLFICLARLLGVPARYRMGYIFTGANYENKIQSEASHAWAEVFLPYVGWRGFDPTNGCLVEQDHIRVASGRNYRDATPTSGTIYKGSGGTETLNVEVKIEEVQDQNV